VLLGVVLGLVRGKPWEIFIWLEKRFPFLKRHAVLLAFLVVLSATLGSLFFSSVAGFAPCTLCWYQRIFIFPQVVILGMALLKKDQAVADYIIALSSVAGVIALYHQYLQFGGSPLVPCSASAEAVSCAQRFILEFGYVTIPMMTLTVSLMVIILMLFVKLNDGMGVSHN